MGDILQSHSQTVPSTELSPAIMLDANNNNKDLAHDLVIRAGGMPGPKPSLRVLLSGNRCKLPNGQHWWQGIILPTGVKPCAIPSCVVSHGLAYPHYIDTAICWYDLVPPVAVVQGSGHDLQIKAIKPRHQHTPMGIKDWRSLG